MTILHLLGSDEWADAASQPSYSAESLESEGFIHCCSAEQLLGVIERYYADRTDLVALELDELRIGSAIVWEERPPNGLFPHVYGPIATAAVLRVVAIPRASDGTFTAPTEFDAPG